MVSIEDTELEGGGSKLYNQIADAAQDTIQRWTGQALRSTSIYGIRIYTEGAVLTPHVDRLPLISSAIVNVDQDLDEPYVFNETMTLFIVINSEIYLTLCFAALTLVLQTKVGPLKFMVMMDVHTMYQWSLETWFFTRAILLFMVVHSR